MPSTAATRGDDCIFCKIVKRERPASIVYEDDDVMAFMDTSPVQEGHTLVIPKRHFRDIWDIEPAQLAKVDAVVRRVAHKMAVTMKAEGINTFSASGKPAGQDVYHFHMHVIPLGKGERTKLAEWWLSRMRRAERAELNALAEKLRL